MRSLILLMLLFTVKLSAQDSTRNLLRNPSFELSTVKPLNFRMKNEIEFDSFSVAWTTQKFGSPDILESEVPYKWHEYNNMITKPIVPHHGSKVVGLRLFGCAENNFVDCREYLVQELAEPMRANHYYRFELWTARLDLAFACQDLAVFFSDTLIDKKRFLTKLKLRPQIKCHAMPGRVPRVWYRLADTILTDKEYNSIYIGSFVDDPGANIDRIEPNAFRQSYYFVDDLKLIDLGPKRVKKPVKPVKTEQIDSTPPPSVKTEILTINNKFVFKNLLFDRAKADILPYSFKELDSIIVYLKLHPNYKIKIEGHTDNEGSNAFNQDLSERRAAAVVNYFNKNGIDAKRMQSQGFGETRHVSDNITPENRHLNRRVEMVILDN